MATERNAKRSPGAPAGVLLVITLTVAFLQIGNAFTFPLLAMWIALAGAKLIANLSAVRGKYPLSKARKLLDKWGIRTENHRKTGSVLRTFLVWNFGTQVAVYLYTVMLVVFQATEGRFLSTNAMTFINGLSAASILYLFGKRGVYSSFGALCLAWVISVVRTFVAPEFESFWKNFELHDMSFGAGYVLLYYVFIHKKWNLSHLCCCALIGLLILLAFKRIGIAALLLTVAVWAALRWVKTVQTRRKILFWGSIAAIVACYLFVWVIVEGWLIEFFEVLGINPMGRNYYYDTLAKHCEFTPWFVGLGRNASATLFTTDYAYLKVGNVHSDILRMYAECGFVLFGLWLLVYWVFLPRSIERKFGYRAREFFTLSTVYTFIVYATDNTELYLVNQYFYMLVAMHVVQLAPKDAAPLEQRVEALSVAVREKIAARREQRAQQEQQWDEPDTEIGYLEHTEAIAEEPVLPQTENLLKLDLPVQEENLTEEPILPQIADSQQTLTDEKLDELMEKYLAELGYEPPAEE